jgi:hypothetical protein
MMGNKDKVDESLMEKGIAQIPKKVPYETRLPSEPCQHIDDGFEYGKRGKKTIRRCDVCGIYYEEDPE